MMRLKYYVPAGIAFCLVLTGCGGGSSTPSTMPGGDAGAGGSVLTGVFVDSPVEGISFATVTQTGTTNASGEFSYLAGERVTFSIGATQLPAVAAAAQITPVDIAASSGNPTAMTTNIARLLQSLDQDGNAENGITISVSAAASAASINFDVGVDEFANDAAVINLVANSGSSTTNLISATAANTHLNSTLGRENAAFNERNLVSGSPWYSVRIFEEQAAECGERYAFSANGSLNVLSNGASIVGTYSLSETGLLNINTGQFGVENWQLVSLDSQEWSTNKINNSGISFLERVFSNRSTALGLSSSLGINCEGVFTE